jgi:hypothetical protein
MATTGRLILALAVTAAVGVGIWGLAASRGAGQPRPAAIGDKVRIPGGLVRVVRAQDVEYKLLPMTGPGMNMATSHGGMPKIPKGYRRIAVEMLLYADADSLEFRAPDFRVGREGLEGSAPLDGFGRTVVPAGIALSRTLEFQVPQDAKGLALTLRGAGRPILLTVPAARSPAHGDGHR